jgi:hypothetical protein
MATRLAAMVITRTMPKTRNEVLHPDENERPWCGPTSEDVAAAEFTAERIRARPPTSQSGFQLNWAATTW